MQCDVTHCVIWIPNNDEYLDKEESCKTKSSLQCNKTLDKISCRKHFKVIILALYVSCFLFSLIISI